MGYCSFLSAFKNYFSIFLFILNILRMQLPSARKLAEVCNANFFLSPPNINPQLAHVQMFNDDICITLHLHLNHGKEHWMYVY